jgi:hypothetical protein
VYKIMWPHSVSVFFTITPNKYNKKSRSNRLRWWLMSSKEFKCVSAEMLWKNELSAANMCILPQVFVQFYIYHSYIKLKRGILPFTISVPWPWDVLTPSMRAHRGHVNSMISVNFPLSLSLCTLFEQSVQPWLNYSRPLLNHSSLWRT